ncbi:MAG: hypothetical protein WKG07_20330 [Hymenobacter sp.]
MELLVFGAAGARVLLFPTRRARFSTTTRTGAWWRPCAPRWEGGCLQLYCLHDSIDAEKPVLRRQAPGRAHRAPFASTSATSSTKVLPLTQRLNPHPCLMAAGCSMGAYHAVNLAFRHPHLFDKVLGPSGRYDLTQPMATFRTCSRATSTKPCTLNTLTAP